MTLIIYRASECDTDEEKRQSQVATGMEENGDLVMDTGPGGARAIKRDNTRVRAGQRRHPPIYSLCSTIG
jgi:hypothetical protein